MNREESNSRASDDGELGSTIDIAQVLAAQRKHKWLILAAAIVCTAAAVAYTSRLPKRYRAVASVVIDPRAPEILGGEVQEVVQMGTGSFWSNQEYYNTQVEIIKSRELAKLTVKQHGLHKNEAFMPDVPEGQKEGETIAAAATKLVGLLEVQPPRENRIMRVAIETGDPELAATVANAHVDTYIQYNIDLRVQGTEVASEWLSGELDGAESALRTSETDLYEFRKNNDILSVSLEDKQNLVATNIGKYTEALASTRAKRMEVGALRNRIHEAREQDLMSSPIFALAENAAGEALKVEYYAERKKLIDLEKEFGPKMEVVKAQLKKLEEVSKALEKEANLAVAAIDERYAAMLATEKSLAGEIERYKKEAFELGPKEVDYNRLSRREKHNEQKYNIVLNRLGASDLASRLKTVNIRLLDKALVPKSATYPSMSKNAGAGLALGLVLGLGLALLLELMDRTIKTTSDVEQAVGAAVLGIIPAVAMGEDGNDERDLLVHRDPKSRVAECCRSIRTNLLFMAAEQKLKTLVVTSANPREGKTTSVLYMGTAMAQSGQRILIIDTDMRRPRLHQSLGVGRSTGLSNVMVGDRELDDVIKATEVPNLYILPCGPTPPNPAELLMTDHFRQVLDELEGKFDRILLDSPPILAVTDAAVLAKQADGVLVVMKAGSTQKADAERAAKTMHDVNARIVGVVLNQLDIDDKSYGYYQHYYSYGYGSDEKADAGAA